MKARLLTAISTLLLFLPWTILPLRTYDWALRSPTAEIMICCYAIVMILGGIFTLVSYQKGNVKNLLMKICLILNNLYAVFGLIVLGQIFLC